VLGHCINPVLGSNSREHIELFARPDEAPGVKRYSDGYEEKYIRSQNIFFLFFHWHYSPLWTLARRTISFHFFLSVTNSLHLLNPSFVRLS
jgi:hypothetical protein